MKNMNRLAGLRLGTLAATLLLTAMQAMPAAQTSTHVMENLATAKWGPAPPMLPPGAQIAVLAGNPTQPGPYTVRLKFPANYEIPAHSHPTDEHVVVVSGEFFSGMGDKMNKKAALRLGVGGFALMPAHGNHFAYTRVETTIMLYGDGPVEFTYVNGADDPRAKTRTSAR
jgi:quercetin dioxygenase-like cupin family protein